MTLLSGMKALRHLRTWACCLGTAAAVAACGEPAGTATSREAVSQVAAATRADAARSVTLITGDRVTLAAGPDAAVVHIEPGSGRAAVGFITLRHGGDVTVIPKDVAPLVAADRVDRALFEVTRLIADGYSDGDRDNLPLIVTGQAPAALTRAAAVGGGVTVHRVIGALGATAVHQAKSSPGAALALVQASAAPVALAGRPAKLWLDRRLRPSLDHSVPQIGGPAAWARGLTGAGVVVAVIDTGIDASHPDLAGKVLDAANFVEDDAGTSDTVGHGTHVASILAGTGAASNDQFRGVAPDAQLVSARVCDDFGCEESAILAGMAWAVADKHAPIVNLSLGGFDTPEIDPLEDAVNQLSAQYGTLFVVAAGNAGQFGDRTLDSPSTAAAALAVGAVDRDDQLAVFSSRGPGSGDVALKPDVTAPGVDIAAAKASTAPPIGDPVGTAYQRLSGTSMATPHVAGAAAILLQQHPDWTGAELKAALMGSAIPNPALTAFAQGAGRIDLDRATRQQVIAELGSLGLGIARWPHDDDPVVTRTVTYRNDGAAPVTLALAANLALAGGTAAPPGMIRVEPAMLTVPAGGTAGATVTVDTRGDAPDGDYLGAVTATATADDVRIATPVAIQREVESHDLTLRATDRDGNPGFSTVVLVTRHPQFALQFLEVAGELTVRLPRDEYAAYAFHDAPVFLVDPKLVLDRDLTVELDARLARPIEVEVRGVALDTGVISAAAYDPVSRLRVGQTSDQGLLTAQIGDSAPPEMLSLAVVSKMPHGTVLDPTGEHEPALEDPYAFAHLEHGRMITGWSATLSPAQLTTVAASHVAASHSSMRRHLWALVDGAPEIGSLETNYFDYPAIAHRTEHLFGPGFRWGTELTQNEQLPFFPPGILANLGEWLAVRSYLPGKHYVERWHHAPFGPSLGQAFRGPPAARTGDRLTISPSLFSDRAVPARDSEMASNSRRMTLFRDGVVFAEEIDGFHFWFPSLDVPSAPATYRFEQEETRGPWAGITAYELSTRVSAAWTFHSQHVDGTAAAILPLPTVRFLPELDDDDRAPGRVMVLPVRVERPPGAATPRITHIRIEISFDDGATWSRVPGVPIGDQWFGVVVHPADAGFASLRGVATDVNGNRNEVTILRAYRVTAP